jgi:hypothetical protein
MKKPFVWYQINSVVQFAVRVLAVEQPALHVTRAGVPALPYPLTDPQALGTLLWDESVRSTASLSGQEAAATRERLFGPYEYVEPAQPPVDALVFLAQCATIEAHSCGSSDYYATVAWLVLHALILRAIRHVPGWASVPWSTNAAGRGSKV